jgi:hypothetical protein
MNNLQTSSQTLPARTAGTSPALRELSTDTRSEWIERIFARLSGIYGSEFTYKWADVDNESLKAEWGDALGGFHADDIAAALQSCRSQPKAPNLPEFAALCRQNMNTRSTPAMAPLTNEQRAAAARVAATVAEGLKSKESNTKGYMVNGVLVTAYKQWAVDLMKREAGGESLQMVSMESWREVLNFPKDMSAKKALEAVKTKEAA